MRDILPFVISGVATGSIYGLAGTGLVLTYKTSGIFNFAHGAIATVAAFSFYWLNVEHGLDWKLAVIVSVLVVGPLMGVLMERIGRRLSMQPTSWKIVGTIGVILLVQGLASVKFGITTLRIDQFLPKGTETFKVGGIFVSYDQVTIAVVTLTVVGLLYALFRWSRTGVAMRAVVDDPDLLAGYGTNPARVRLLAWVIGSTFAALSGVLVAPLIGLEAILLTFLVVQAFGAAAFGQFASIPLTFLGGIVIGIAADVSKKYVLDVSWLAGLPASLPFIALFGVLLVLPRRRLTKPGAYEIRPPLQYYSPMVVRVVTGLVVLCPLLLVPTFVGTKLSFFTLGLTQIIMILSLGLLVRTSGQVSLAHAAFAAIGAVAFSQFRVDHGLPWLVALVLAGLVAVPVGALVAVPAIRLSGVYLALATFGFGLMLEKLAYPLMIMFTPFTEGRAMPRPSFGRSDEGYYYVVLAFVVLTAVTMVAIHRARLGRVLRGMSDSSVAVATMGLSTNMTRVIVFCISAFFAAIAGALYGGSVHIAIATDARFTAFNSLILLAVLALAPFAEPWYAVFAGIAAVIPGYLGGQSTTYWMNALFGFFAVVVALEGKHPSMPMRVRRVLDRFGQRDEVARLAKVHEAPEHAAPLSAAIDAGEAPQVRSGLEVSGLTVRFGGLVAVSDLSFSAPPARITGLIGPNGAGKTTTFDACSGLNRRVDGAVRLHGSDITRLSPAARGRLGLGRTFQRMQLCDSLTVAENVALGREAGLAGAHVLRQIVAPPSERSSVAAATSAALDSCGIAHLASRQAGTLTTGQRRLVELARCLAGPFDMLLLDEPSSGLDREETERFGEVLTTVAAERGCGVLLVEHDMSLVMRVCAHIYVLDFGKLIFEGDPEGVAASAIVQAAYLGTESVSSPRPLEVLAAELLP